MNRKAQAIMAEPPPPPTSDAIGAPQHSVAAGVGSPTELEADAARASTSELLLLPDGRVLVHNLTPAMAAMMTELNPADGLMKLRAALLTRSGDRQTPAESG